MAQGVGKKYGGRLDGAIKLLWRVEPRQPRARALARKPSVLLLDEPFGALDSFTRMKLQDHLGVLWERSRFTLILVTHDVDEAITLSDRIVVMRGQPGRIYREIAVSPPRPRGRTAPEFQKMKDEVTLALDIS